MIASAARIAAAAAALVAVGSASASADRPLGGSFLASGASAGATTAATLPSGFQDSVVLGGLTLPTAVRFASDGRVFVAEKSGLIKEFDSLSDTTPTIVADLRTKVDDYWDRGLLGLALDPNFPTNPYVYVLYTYDAPPGGTAPRWNDACPTPPGPTTDGCVVQGRLARLTLSGNTSTNEQLLIQGWCQQFPSHSIGDLRFGTDGSLFVSGGDGASFGNVDYGEFGGSSGSPTPANPCGDPPAPTGTALSPPTAEGGSLRSQSPRRASGEPVLLNGAILRVDPATGAGVPSNPLFSSTDANARRIVAYGLRNPFRFTLRPGTNDVWLGDVGWNDWEEVNRVPDPTSGPLNFGWPCYEGVNPQPGYQSAGLNICSGLYAGGGGSGGTFGTTTPGASIDTASSDLKEVSKYTAAAGSVTKLTGYVSGLGAGSGSQRVKAIIYADSGGSPGARLGVSNEVTINAGRAWAWTDFTFPSPVPVSAGPIWMGYIASTTSDLTQLRYDNSAGDLRYNLNSGGYAAGPTNPFGTTTTSNKHYSLYATLSGGGGGGPVVTAPLFTYNHAAHVVAGDPCPTGGSSIAGMTFYNGGSYPGTYTGALFFEDHTRGCIWVMMPGANGLPDPSQISVFESGAASPVDLETGPGGDLFYVDFDGNALHRIRYLSSNNPPTAVATANPTSGSTPLTVNFDGSGSSDPDGDPITYAWDLDGDGAFDDSTAVKPTFTYTTPGTYTVRLKVTDSKTASAISSPITISAGNDPPVPTITAPDSSLTWKVGDPISFSGGATDPQDGTEPASRLSWTLIIHHCFDPTNCHTHLVQTWNGVASGSFNAPDHEYPCWLELQLTASDSAGATATTSVRLDPQTVNLTVASNPTGAQVAINEISGAAPLVKAAVIGSLNTISAPSPQTIGGSTYAFGSWSDGGAQTHNVVAPAADTTYTATFTRQTTGTFGTTTIGTSIDSASVNLKEVSRYTAVAANVTKLTGYISGLGAGSGSQKVKAVIYADNGGNPGALLGVSNEVTISAGKAWAWTDFTFPSAVAVQAGTIWMGYIASTTSDLTQLRYDSSPGELRYNANAGGYAAGPTSPFGTPTLSNKHYSLYATYRTGGTAVAPTPFAKLAH